MALVALSLTAGRQLRRSNHFPRPVILLLTIMAVEVATANGASKPSGKALKSKNQLRRAKQKQKKTAAPQVGTLWLGFPRVLHSTHNCMFSHV